MHDHLSRAPWPRRFIAAVSAGLMAACGGGDDPTGEAQAVAHAIPPDGGTLVARGADDTIYTLHIPSGALAQATRISVTPLARGGVLLQPAGLVLQAPAELTIEPAAASVYSPAAVRVMMTEIPDHTIATSPHD